MIISPSLKLKKVKVALRKTSNSHVKKGLSFIFVVLFFLGNSAYAIIGTDWQEKRSVDFERLTISKKQLFAHIKDSILQKPKGLGNFGRISIKLCTLEVNGQKLIDLNTKDGKKVRFLSNPSCSLLLLEKLLISEYQLIPYSFSAYEKRKCFLTVEQIISPLLEFYSIQYEERQKECRICDSLERSRLKKILKLRKNVTKSCKKESRKTIQLIDDLDHLIEQTYQEKNKP